MIDIASLPLVELTPPKPARKRAGKPRSEWHSLPKDPTPITRIRTHINMAKVGRIDWLHPDLFPGQDVDAVLAGLAGSSDIRVGCFAVTMTFDRKRSGFVEDGAVDFDRWTEGHNSSLNTAAYVRRKRMGRHVYAPPAVAGIDVHEDGFPHMHQIFFVRNEHEASILKSHLAWWTRKHGDVDVRPLCSRTDVLKWLQYIVARRPWHDNIPVGRGFESVLHFRNLVIMQPRDLPRIVARSIEAVSDDDHDPDGGGGGKKAVVPIAVEAFGSMHSITSGPIRSISSMQDLDRFEIAQDIASVQDRGPLAVFGRYLRYAISVLPSEAVKQAVIDRTTASGFVQSFLTIFMRGGLRRAVKYLKNKIFTVEVDFAWRTIETLRVWGLKCGIRVTNSLGVSRVEWNLDLGKLFGVAALTPDEVSERRNMRRCA